MTSQRAQRLLGKMGPGLNLTSANEQLHTLEKTLLSTSASSSLYQRCKSSLYSFPETAVTHTTNVVA